jgi:hypothetical protein
MSNIKLSYIRRRSSRITASPAPLLHRHVLKRSGDPEAVMLHFVAPIGAGWRTVGKRRLARANETAGGFGRQSGAGARHVTFFKADPFCIADYVVERGF